MSTVQSRAPSLVVLVFSVCLVGAAPETIKPTNLWKGSVNDTDLKKNSPKSGWVTDAKTFTAIVTGWKVAEKVPEVDFTKEVVYVGTTVGSLLNLDPVLDEKGNLKVIGSGTLDFGEGFRFVIITIPIKGVKTLDGKPLPK